jgi:hypothetical protein
MFKQHDDMTTNSREQKTEPYRLATTLWRPNLRDAGPWPMGPHGRTWRRRQRDHLVRNASAIASSAPPAQPKSRLV